MKHILVASDFDQTLSFNDSGAVLSELIGASRFEHKVEGLARTNLVQQGGELAYLIRHDPEFRGDDAFSIMVPVLEHVLGWSPGAIRALFESNGLRLHEWERARTDRVTVRDAGILPGEAVA